MRYLNRSSLIAFIACLALLGPVRAQTVVNSIFHGSGSYSDPSNWSPSEVPNNSANKVFNITVDTDFGVTIDQDATVSNVVFLAAEFGVLSAFGHTFNVLGTTLHLSGDISAESTEGAPAVFNAGTLSSFSDHTLRGNLYVASSANSPATLRFKDADVVTLGRASLLLTGPLSRVTDQNDNDGLRNLSSISAEGTFALDGRDFATGNTFTNLGKVRVGAFNTPTIFTVPGALTNFDPVSRTLTGGSFALGQPYVDSRSGAIELRFAGADIVNNRSSISLVGEETKITDLARADALRNLAHNSSDGILEMQYRRFATAGNFTNDGTLKLYAARFTVTGDFINFDPASRTLTGGAYELSGGNDEPGALVFSGADIVRNAASITLGFAGSILDQNGQDALRHFAENLSEGVFTVEIFEDFVTGGDFANAGVVFLRNGGEISGGNRPGSLTIPTGFRYVQTAGRTTNQGRITAEVLMIDGGIIEGQGIIKGDVFVGGGTFTASQVDGNLTLSPASTFAGTAVTVSGGLHLDGTLQIPSGGGFPGSGDVITLLSSGAPLTGRFSNVANGGRLTTVDGRGSFVVTYRGNEVVLLNFEENPRAGQLLNISGRAAGYIGDRAIISGFIIVGAEPKKVILRAIGPSQGPDGIWMQNPTLALHSADRGLLAANNNWKETQQAEIEATGLAPTDDRESAIVTVLSPGAYTCVLESAERFAGRALVEVFDLASETGRLGNISTRGPTYPEDPLIGGITVGGNGPANGEVVVRAIGPSLREYGVSGAVLDPQLEVRDSNGALVAANDDWLTNEAEFLASPSLRSLAPENERESALHVSLPAGQYTALVRGKDAASGVALVELYDLRG